VENEDKVPSNSFLNILCAFKPMPCGSYRSEEYTSGSHKDWDVDLKCSDLELPLAALDISGDEGEVEFPILPIHTPVLLSRHLVLFLLMMMKMKWICMRHSLIFYFGSYSLIYRG
jgi:hypothetical protein